MSFVHKQTGETDHTHETVDQARQCQEWFDYAASGQMEADSLAELEAERRNEEFWENRGADDGFEEWERSRGVISYEEARDLAAAGLNPAYGALGVRI